MSLRSAAWRGEAEESLVFSGFTRFLLCSISSLISLLSRDQGEDWVELNRRIKGRTVQSSIEVLIGCVSPLVDTLVGGDFLFAGFLFSSGVSLFYSPSSCIT